MKPPQRTEAERIAGLSANERRALRRRVCGWCEASLTAERCQAMYGAKCTAAEMAERRSKALASYKPRALLSQEQTDER